MYSLKIKKKEEKMEDSILRNVQLVQLEIAKEVKRVCELNNLNVFLVSGTLLGAIRHKGFIPWDDDLDLGMMRNDYDEFLRIAKNQLDNHYSIVDWLSDMEYPHPMAKVVKNGTLFKEKKRRDKSNHGIWIDIFPIDVAPDDEQDRFFQRKEIILNRALARSKCKCITWYDNNRFLITKYIKNLPIRIISVFLSKSKIVTRYEEAARKFNCMDSRYYYDNGCDSYSQNLIPNSCFQDFVKVEFENEIFNAPKEYDLYLKTLYGNYMELPPINKRENRHMIEIVEFDVK